MDRPITLDRLDSARARGAASSATPAIRDSAAGSDLDPVAIPAAPTAIVRRLMRATRAGLAAMIRATSVSSPGAGALGLQAGSVPRPLPGAPDVEGDGQGREQEEDTDDCVSVGCSQTLGRGPRRARRP